LSWRNSKREFIDSHVRVLAIKLVWQWSDSESWI